MKNGFINPKVFKESRDWCTPLKIHLVTNYTCNLDCKYCDVGILSKRSMTTREIVSLITEFKQMGVQQIDFIGGEPLLRPDIHDFLRYSQSLGITTAVHSNGNLVVQMKQESLKDIDIFITCINGPRHIHEYLRGQDTYDKTLKAIELMAGLSKKVMVDMILTRLNCTPESINHVADLAKDLGFVINFQKVFKNNLVNAQNSSIAQLSLSDAQIRGAFDYILHKLDPEKIFNSQEYLEDMSNRGWSHFPDCHLGRFIFVVDPAGRLSRCYKFIQEPNNPNGLQLGWRQALAQVPLPECSVCEYSAHIEDNYYLHNIVQKGGLPASQGG